MAPLDPTASTDGTAAAALSTSPQITPSVSLVQTLRDELMQHMPFSRMQPAHVERLVVGARQAYFAPGDIVLAPASGVASALIYLRRGSVDGRRGLADATEAAAAAGGFEYTAGELFPVGAVLAARAVTVTYTAPEDCFCLLLPAEAVQALALASPPFADFLTQRMAQYLALSRRAVQAAWSSQTLAEQSLEPASARCPTRRCCAAPAQHRCSRRCSRCTSAVSARWWWSMVTQVYAAF
ncbi:MAG: hypothetical protein LH480_05420 [Rubrivivax sp.]|nr:hypothetical protein [Rubrivivax sp.]